MGIESRIVLVDMDGVLADFEKPNNEIILKHFPLVEPIPERKEFYYHETYLDKDVQDIIYIENRRPGFFTSFPLVEGALIGWQRIIDAGYTPRVCSSPLEDHPTVIQEKKEWLEEYFAPLFGRSVIDNAIFDRDKSSYEAVAMIDDRPTLRNIEQASWQHIVFDRSYNRSVPTNYRLMGWHDPRLKYLLEVIDHFRKQP